MIVKEVLFGGTGTGNKYSDVGLLILRAFAGLAMAFAHGLGKVQDPGKAIGAARSLEFPFPEGFGWAAILAEFIGGILLALGLFTRPAAFLMACTMIVAAFMIHATDPFRMKEMALLYLAISLLFIGTGGGTWSVDRLIKR